MQYYSLNHNSPLVDFKTATIKGQAPDKGLYFPETIPVLDQRFIEGIVDKCNEEIAYKVIAPYIGNTIPPAVLQQIVNETVNFPIPLKQINERVFVLEMFHGNTLAFKDIGARFMSRCLGYFVRGNDRKITVLVATSGDTGGAVADGFYGVDGIDVVILYPSGKVSLVQEKQLTTLGRNVQALEVTGSFDDCQLLVKTAFADADLNSQLFLTSANSINVARWLPQQFFYFFAYKQWPDKMNPPVIAVPSGNFGNICAGLLAMKSGLPVKRFIAACNANDVIPNYLNSGIYQPQKARPTISNAMDVGDPSNFVRILQLFNHNTNQLKEALVSCSVSDDDTRNAIQELYSKYNYLPDPHGAVGYVALTQYHNTNPAAKGIFAETAHPVKFFDVVEPVIAQAIPLPNAIQAIMDKPKQAISLSPDFHLLKDFLLSRS